MSLKSSVLSASCLFILLFLSLIFINPQHSYNGSSGSQSSSKTAGSKLAAVDKNSPSLSVVKNPPSISTAPALSFSRQNIITTVFWVGEGADSSNGYISNQASAWDEQWLSHFGGVDNPNARNGFFPAGFNPKENPFYIALPYNDFGNRSARKATAGGCPLRDSAPQKLYSWCKNSWIAIRHGDKIVYGQWEDVGPFEEDDSAYVFGSSLPRNQQGEKAGFDVSPAIQRYLGLSDVDRVDWAFVPFSAVPTGEWTKIVTSTLGDSL